MADIDVDKELALLHRDVKKVGVTLSKEINDAADRYTVDQEAVAQLSEAFAKVTLTRLHILDRIAQRNPKSTRHRAPVKIPSR